MANQVIEVGLGRTDGREKAKGKSVFTADVELPDMAHAAIVRSDFPHARISRIDATDAMAYPGVIAVVTSKEIPTDTFGRRVRDMPLLARDKVRFIGEPIAAVVAESRDVAESAAATVIVEYDILPAATSMKAALAEDAPLIHEAPWTYPGAAINESEGQNLQSVARRGVERSALLEFERSEFRIDATYRTPASHAGYLEPQACIAKTDEVGTVHLWATNKAPYRLRAGIEEALRIPAEEIIIHPVKIGGDFGGKGAFSHIPLCVALSRITRRSVKLVLRYWEDLIATNPRHSTETRVRVGCDSEGRLKGLLVNVLADGGAYAAAKPSAEANLRGFLDPGSSYRIPALYVESRIAYTNTVPRGHVREPGGPQLCFAIESALDELAEVAGINPVRLRESNLLRDGEPTPYGTTWEEARGRLTLQAATKKPLKHSAPDGWLRGTGVAISNRETNPPNRTSIRLIRTQGGMRVEVPIPETGTGSHTVVREGVARGLGLPSDAVEVAHVPTGSLPYDHGVGGSRVTVSMLAAVEKAVEEWTHRADPTGAVEVETNLGDQGKLTSFCVQVADVAVDPDTGEFRVLELITSVDTAHIVNPRAHQMQIDGGAVMGLGFSCLEDLMVDHGQVVASTLGDYKLPSTVDLPELTTVLVSGARGMGRYNVKNVGELSNVPTAAAIANAIAAATGIRLRTLPLRASDIWEALETSGVGS